MTSDTGLDLDLVGTELAVCRLAADAELPAWVALDTPGPVSVTRTATELSLVLPQERVPDAVPAERGWRAMVVRGPLDFTLVGILARLTATLARAEVALFALSTHDTDWLLVRDHDLPDALAALAAAGHRVHTPRPTAPPQGGAR